MLRFRRFLTALVALAVVSMHATSSAAEPELLAYSATPAADGSVELILDFDAIAPQVQVVHVTRDDVKVIIVGVSRGPNLPGVIAPAGAIKRGVVAPFAGIGLVIDLQLASDVRPHVETVGSRVVVHIPAERSDEEAHMAGVVTAEAEGVKIIPLSFADVSEIAGLVKGGVVVPSVDLFTAQSPFAAPTPSSQSYSSSSSSSQQQNSTPTYVTLPTSALIAKDTAQGVYVNDNVSVDRRLNAVILRGTKEEMAPYERLISLVDTPRREVLLETQIVELTESAAYALGIDYSPNGTSLATATFSAGNPGPTNTGGALTVGSTIPRTNVSISAQLSALATTGQAKILANPRILAADNRMAAILSGEAVPIFTELLVPSGGTTIVQQQLQYINVGVSLEILPRIASNGAVTADVFSEVSSILSYVQTAPQIAVRQELTDVTVQDGQSVLIGGLLLDTEIKSYEKVPGLGDIPLIGELFKQASTEHQRTNLYLVITPHVLTKASSFPTPPPGN
jgi:general secretion pathway protein D